MAKAGNQDITSMSEQMWKVVRCLSDARMAIVPSDLCEPHPDWKIMTGDLGMKRPGDESTSGATTTWMLKPKCR